MVLAGVETSADLIDCGFGVTTDITDEVVQVFGRKTVVSGRLFDVLYGLPGRCTQSVDFLPGGILCPSSYPPSA